jgi:DNA-directed RNA polymerase specialized sigma24 family protein
LTYLTGQAVALPSDERPSSDSSSASGSTVGPDVTFPNEFGATFSRIAGYVFNTLNNLERTCRRQKRSRTRVESSPRNVSEPADEPTARGHGPDELAELAELRVEIRRLVRGLPPPEGAIITYMDLLGYSAADCAQALRLSRSVVLRKRQQAIRTLRPLARHLGRDYS